MSQCVRSVSSRLLTCVNSRKQLIKIDCRLPKHVKRCALIQKYGTLSLSKADADEAILSSWKNRFIGICGNEYRSYSTEHASKNIVDTSDDMYVDNSKNNQNEKGPTLEQLKNVYNTLQEDLPNIFVAPIDYRIYSLDIEFINNLKGVTTVGIQSYIRQVLYLRTSAHFLYAYVKFHVLKITMNPEDNTIKVRWRISGLPGLKVFTMFWKFKVLRISGSMKEFEVWHDGFSTYYVGSDGLVYKHVADKMMPDEETIQAKDKPDIATKLAA